MVIFVQNASILYDFKSKGLIFLAKAEYKSAIRSRKLICMALADLLQEKPMDKITVTDIVNRADINRGTFYAHYMDIPDVVNHLIDAACTTIQEALQEQLAIDANDPAILLRHLQILLENDLEFYRKVLTSNASIPILEKLRNIYLDYMKEHERQFSTTTHEKYVFMIMFSSGGIINMYRDWFAGKMPFTFDELTEQAIQTVRTILA